MAGRGRAGAGQEHLPHRDKRSAACPLARHADHAQGAGRHARAQRAPHRAAGRPDAGGDRARRGSAGIGAPALSQGAALGARARLR